MTRHIFTGSRNWSDVATVRVVVDALPVDAVVVHGDCNRYVFDRSRRRVGLDMIVDGLARERGLSVEAFPADWDRLGKSAGPIRNGQILTAGAVHCHAFPLPDSTGTWDMVRQCSAKWVPVTVYKVKP